MKNTRTLNRIYPFIAVLIIAIAASSPAAAFSVKEEIELGRKIDIEIMKEMPLSNDETAQKEIQDLGAELAKHVNRPEIPYHFKIIQDDDFNAFTVPGGYVYFTERLWNVLRRDERTGVLAHEITHSDGRHVIDAISKRQRRQIWMAVLLVAIGANQTWGDIASLAETLYSLKYSRGDEQVADTGAVELSLKAGMNPAGILLAMRKIQRFQSEAGGPPPKIFSSHPPTKERLDYLTKLLTEKNIPIPPEQIGEVPNPHKIGSLTAVRGASVEFKTATHLKHGDVVWVMTDGWDYYYENKTAVPAGRVVVTGTSGALTTGSLTALPQAKKGEIAAGAGVYAPPSPAPETGVATMQPAGGDASLGLLKPGGSLKARDRLLARQVVWNKDNTALTYDSVGYVVVTDPSRETGYVGVQRPKYAYALVSANSALIRYADPDQARWIGPIVSIGRGGQTIEVLSDRRLDPTKTYEVAYPGWNKEDTYARRVVGKAELKSTDKKIVLKMTSYSPGWSISDVQNGFDVYEAEPKKAEPEEAN